MAARRSGVLTSPGRVRRAGGAAGFIVKVSCFLDHNSDCNCFRILKETAVICYFFDRIEFLKNSDDPLV